MTPGTIAQDRLTELIERARRTYATIGPEHESEALHRALDIGDWLAELRTLAGGGREWGPVRDQTGIPTSTVSLYIRLASRRADILGAGCKSIREAERFIKGRDKQPPKQKRTRSSSSTRGTGSTGSTYDQGFADGFEEGKKAGFAEGHAVGLSEISLDGADGDIGLRDLRWALKRIHPDHNEGSKTAERVTKWLNALIERKRGQR